jgi:hypothetical protein
MLVIVNLRIGHVLSVMPTTRSVETTRLGIGLFKSVHFFYSGVLTIKVSAKLYTLFGWLEKWLMLICYERKTPLNGWLINSSEQGLRYHNLVPYVGNIHSKHIWKANCTIHKGARGENKTILTSA